MNGVTEGLYTGHVVHKRVAPRRHALRYSVFSCLFDCSDLPGLERRLRLFSLNRFNLFSLYERDHLDGGELQRTLDAIAMRSGQGDRIARFMMLCYPRILGYAFNPLTIYFGLDADDSVRLVIYEVRNTFGGRQTYVLPAEPDPAGIVSQACRKRLYVSPFNAVEGDYSFHATPLGDDLTVGVALRTAAGPVLKAHFRGRRSALTDANLLRAIGRTGWMTLKVIAGIHYEALKLWLKGMRVKPRPEAPASPVTYISTPKESH